MSGELCIMDDRFERELLNLEPPLAFIDFEAIFANNAIPGAKPTEQVPCQWSCHTLYRHGLDWEGNISHDEFLWTGDVGWNPIYAFVESLYEATRDANTILTYSDYESKRLNLCMLLAQNDMAAIEAGEISADYLVVDAYGDKVPLRSIAPKIEGWCNEMMDKFYDQCYGHNTNGGVALWLQAPGFKKHDSIKYVFPVCADEYSRSAELLSMYGIPANGYDGLRAMGQIAKGDECMAMYQNALYRPPREGVPVSEPGAAPFDAETARQCLLYCCLDTLSMVIIYLAVLEATDTWRRNAQEEIAEFARLNGSEQYHSIITNPDLNMVYTACVEEKLYDMLRNYDQIVLTRGGSELEDQEKFDLIADILEDMDFAYPISHSDESRNAVVEWASAYDIQNMNVRDMYAAICPECRRIRNEAGKRR